MSRRGNARYASNTASRDFKCILHLKCSGGCDSVSSVNVGHGHVLPAVDPKCLQPLATRVYEVFIHKTWSVVARNVLRIRAFKLVPENREEAHKAVAYKRHYIGDGDAVNHLRDPAHQRCQNRSPNDRHHDQRTADLRVTT